MAEKKTPAAPAPAEAPVEKIADTKVEVNTTVVEDNTEAEVVDVYDRSVDVEQKELDNGTVVESYT